MKVIVVGKDEKHGNPFFNEILAFTQQQCVYTSWDQIQFEENEIILFQWPELIFDWEEPTFHQLSEFQKKVDKWKKLTHIIYLVHNEKRHYGMTPNFQRLYDIVEGSADTMVHFGNYSKSLFLKRYPNKNHVVIPHPLYLKSFATLSKEDARKKLNIPLDRYVMTVPGRIRNEEERRLVKRAFSYLPMEKKTLLVPYMLRKQFPFQFAGRHLLKRVVDIKKAYENRENDSRPPHRYYGFDHLQPQELSLFLSAADVVFIPRIDILNSGNVYLAMTFKKPFCGANKGNIKEVLEEFSMPSFNPYSRKSLKSAMRELVITTQGKESYKEEKLERFHPHRIAFKWDKLLSEITT